MASRLRFLLVALTLAAAGCTVPVRPPERPPDEVPPVQVPESTLLQIDGDVGAASNAAKAAASDYARGAMTNWRKLIQTRTETDFIPWYTSFWTQQWLAAKIAWYKLSAEKGTDPSVERLSAYLQEQYRERVLAPVATEIDPDKVREHATTRYVQSLREQLQALPQRDGIPNDQFDRRLKDIPAIALAPGASLYQIAHADPLATLPAYAALTARIRTGAGGTGNGPSDARIAPIAKRASDILAARLIASSAAGAASAAVGGGAGVIISLGSAVFGVAEHEKDRPAMEAQLRETLNRALDDMWLNLVDDRAAGVMAEVHYLSQQIEGSLVTTLTHAAASEPTPQGIPLPDEPRSGDDPSHGVELHDGQENR